MTADQQAVVPPSNFVCPLTLEVMTHPVMTKYGHCYEKKALLTWINRGNGTCPLTGQSLSPSDVISHRSLEQQITGWKKLHGVIVQKSNESQAPVLIACNDASLDQRAEDKLVAHALRLMQQHKENSKSNTSNGSRNKKEKNSFTRLIRRTLLGGKNQDQLAVVA